VCTLGIRIVGANLINVRFSSLNRTGASEFIVPYCKFLETLNCPFSIGMRFKVGSENEDANQRYTLLTLEMILPCTAVSWIVFYVCRSCGLISGISEVDSIGWPGSKWRCLQVSFWMVLFILSSQRIVPSLYSMLLLVVVCYRYLLSAINPLNPIWLACN